jgi:hypothetical protein
VHNLSIFSPVFKLVTLCGTTSKQASKRSEQRRSDSKAADEHQEFPSFVWRKEWIRTCCSAPAVSPFWRGGPETRDRSPAQDGKVPSRVVRASTLKNGLIKGLSYFILFYFCNITAHSTAKLLAMPQVKSGDYSNSQAKYRNVAISLRL